MRKLATFFAACGLVALTALPAGAHAFPVKTDPAVGWTVHTSPKQVTIWYTMGVQPGLGFIKVVSEAGRVVSVGDTRLTGPHNTVLIQALKPLAPGRYTVSWHVLAEDGHPSQGHFTFVVRS